MDHMLVALKVFHIEISPLKEVATKNMYLGNQRRKYRENMNVRVQQH